MGLTWLNTLTRRVARVVLIEEGMSNGDQRSVEPANVELPSNEIVAAESVATGTEHAIKNSNTN